MINFALIALTFLPHILAQSTPAGVSVSLTTTTALPFPSSTLSPSDTASFLVPNWGLSKGKVEVRPDDISFVSSPISPTSSTTNVFQVSYPAGSYSHQTGGTQFYSIWNGTTPFQSMELTYEVAFDEGFDWVKGGKLPGIRGGPQPDGCSGGSQPDGTDCFSVRLMWRAGGAGEAYAYIPTPNNICSAQGIICNPTDGTSIHRGSFTFQSGKWNKVSLIVLLNSPVTATNGYIQVNFNDQLAFAQGGLQIRAGDVITAGGLYFSTFFGGSDTTWATPKDTHTYFRNIQLSAGSAPSSVSPDFVAIVGNTSNTTTSAGAPGTTTTGTNNGGTQTTSSAGSNNGGKQTTAAKSSASMSASMSSVFRWILAMAFAGFVLA